MYRTFHIELVGKFALNVSEKFQGLMFRMFPMILDLVDNIRLRLSKKIDQKSAEEYDGNELAKENKERP